MVIEVITDYLLGGIDFEGEGENLGARNILI